MKGVKARRESESCRCVSLCFCDHEGFDFGKHFITLLMSKEGKTMTHTNGVDVSSQSQIHCSRLHPAWRVRAVSKSFIQSPTSHSKPCASNIHG